MSRINLVSVDNVISKKNIPKHTYLPEYELLNIYWVFPEIYAQKILPKDTLIKHINRILSFDQIKKIDQENFEENFIEENLIEDNFIEENIEKIRILRESSSPRKKMPQSS